MGVRGRTPLRYIILIYLLNSNLYLKLDYKSLKVRKKLIFTSYALFLSCFILWAFEDVEFFTASCFVQLVDYIDLSTNRMTYSGKKKNGLAELIVHFLLV